MDTGPGRRAARPPTRSWTCRRAPGFRVSVRRTLRVGADRVGTPVEDFGVVPDERHELTRDDILGDNHDLLARAGELLAGRPGVPLALADPPEVRADGRCRLRLTTAGLDRVDVAFDGRPVASLDVDDGTVTPRCAGGAVPANLDLMGWSDGAIVPAERRSCEASPSSCGWLPSAWPTALSGSTGGARSTTVGGPPSPAPRGLA